MKEIALHLVEPQNLLLYLFAYGLAAMPTSYAVAKIIHRYDVERASVKSHTASFLWHKLSIRSAILVFILDLLKGLIPCAIALSLGVSAEAIAFIGLFAVVGHCFSIVLRFSGGHGGTTFAGVLLIIAFPAAVITLLTNYLLIVLKCSPSLASTIASLLGMIVLFFVVDSGVVLLIVAVMVVVIFVRHTMSAD